MMQEEFVEAVAKLVAALQVPVSMLPRHVLGAAYEPWERLSAEVTGGFGWMSEEQCKVAFARILNRAS